MSGQFIRRFGTPHSLLSKQTAVFRKDVVQIFFASEMVENEARRPGLDPTWIPLKTGIGQALSPLIQESICKPVVH